MFQLYYRCHFSDVLCQHPQRHSGVQLSASFSFSIPFVHEENSIFFRIWLSLYQLLVRHLFLLLGISFPLGQSLLLNIKSGRSRSLQQVQHCSARFVHHKATDSHNKTDDSSSVRNAVTAHCSDISALLINKNSMREVCYRPLTLCRSPLIKLDSIVCQRMGKFYSHTASDCPSTSLSCILMFRPQSASLPQLPKSQCIQQKLRRR